MLWQTAISQPSELGESPFWHPDEQRLYWVDIPARQVCRSTLTDGLVERWTLPSEPGCIAPARSGGQNTGLVIALRDGIYRARHWGGELVLLAPALHDPATSRFNDGKADPLGRFWAGTIYEPRDAARAQLFSLDVRDGRPAALQTQAGNATTANGLAWSPDAATLYWSDTPSHTIRAWDWDAASNTLSRERVFYSWPGKPEGWQPGMPDYGGGCSSCRPLANCWPNLPCPRNARPCPALAALTSKRSTSPPRAKSARRTSWRSGRSRAVCFRCRLTCRACR